MRSKERNLTPFRPPPVLALSLCLLGACGRFGVEILPAEDSPPQDPNDASAGPDLDAGFEDVLPDDAGGTADPCTLSCANSHGTAMCVADSCSLSCSLGYADCDGDPTNGCEVETASSTLACGSCDTNCENPHGEVQCGSGLCTPSCQTGFADCDGNAQNGCETDLADVSHCGTCDMRCENTHGTTSCVSGSCTPACASGYADCDGDPTNGCEAHLESDPTHCGACPNVCGTNGQICTNGTCQASPCAAGLAECDGDLTVTCETDTTNSLQNCGFCGNACTAANATSVCTAGTCQVGACNAGYANCDGSAQNGCEATLATDTAHCGACGTVCTNAHGTTSCIASTCSPQCSTGYDDCDNLSENGCETSLESSANCGVCGRACPPNGGTPVCNAGICDTICDLTGTFALKLSVQTSWPNATYISSGSGTLLIWMKLSGTHSGNTMSGALLECGRYVPTFRSAIVPETYSFQHPTANFDQVPPYFPSTDVSITLGSASPGASLSLPRTATQFGVRMADPVNGVWPSSAAGLTPVDDDGDGKPGVSVVYENSGSYVYARTSASLFGFNRADSPYIASRVAFSLGGSLTSCAQASGSATVTNVDTRIFGCSRSSSSQDCNSTEGNFLDQNHPRYTFGSASYTLVKVANNATCADVRGALP